MEKRFLLGYVTNLKQKVSVNRARVFLSISLFPKMDGFG